VVATYHPSFALRQENDEARERVLEAIASALARARNLADRERERWQASR
jgi:DNA polymerase